MRKLLSLSPATHLPTLLSIDEDTMQVTVNGKSCPLTGQEYYLLQELIRHIDMPVSRDELLREAWGYVNPGITRTVDVHIQRLRRKIGVPCIETIYKRGYRLRAEALA